MTRPRGQALVEFALILPLLLFLIIGGLGLSLIAMHRIDLQYAAHEAAGVAAATSCGEALVRLDQLLGYTPDEADCQVTGPLVEVSVAQHFPALLPVLPERIAVTARAALH